MFDLLEFADNFMDLMIFIKEDLFMDKRLIMSQMLNEMVMPKIFFFSGWNLGVVVGELDMIGCIALAHLLKLNFYIKPSNEL